MGTSLDDTLFRHNEIGILMDNLDVISYHITILHLHWNATGSTFDEQSKKIILSSRSDGTFSDTFIAIVWRGAFSACWGEQHLMYVSTPQMLDEWLSWLMSLAKACLVIATDAVRLEALHKVSRSHSLQLGLIRCIWYQERHDANREKCAARNKANYEIEMEQLTKTKQELVDREVSAWHVVTRCIGFVMKVLHHKLLTICEDLVVSFCKTYDLFMLRKHSWQNCKNWKINGRANHAPGMNLHV